MIKLAFIISGLARGGAEKMLVKLLSHIDRSQFEPCVFCLTNRDKLSSEIEALGIKVHLFQLNHPLRFIPHLVKFLKAVRNFEPTLIQGWMYHGNLFAWLAGKVYPAKLIFGIRVCLYDFKYERLLTRYVIRLGQYLSSATDGILYVCDAAKQQHEALGYKSNLSVTIPNGFDLNQFRPSDEHRQAYRARLMIREDQIILGYFARFHKMKGHQVLIEAFAKVRSKRPAAKLILAGYLMDEHNTAIMHAIQTHKLSTHVELLGELKTPEQALPVLDLFISPSLQEGFPNVVGEAMACGVPCVVTDVGDSVLAVGNTGFVVPPDDSGALANAILGAISNLDELRILGQQARERVETEFSLPAIVKKYEAVYTEFVEKA